MHKVKNIGQGTFWMMAFCAAFFSIKLQVPFTNSGEITVGLAELLGIAAAAYVLYYLLKNFKMMSRDRKILVWVAVISQGALLLIWLFRAVFVGLELKSLLVLEANVCVLSFFFLILLDVYCANRVLLFLSLFSAFWGAVSVGLILFWPQSITDLVLASTPHFDLLLWSHAIRTFVLLVCLPLSMMHCFVDRTPRSAVLFAVHFVALVICAMISGARLNYVCVPLGVVFLCAVLLRFKSKQRVRALVGVCGAFVAAVIAVFAIAPHHMLTYTQLTRLEISNRVIEALDITYVVQETQVGDPLTEQSALEEMLQQAAGSAQQSALSREKMWSLALADIREAPLFGKGLLQYAFTFENGGTLYMQAHNFLLEYVLAFGIVGFLFWLLMMAAPVWLILRRLRCGALASLPVWTLSCALFFAFCGAFLQPYFLFSGVMLFVFVAMGLCYRLSQEGMRSDPVCIAER